jgi:hypothetical protein
LEGGGKDPDGTMITVGIDQSLPLEIVEGRQGAVLRMDGYLISGHDSFWPCAVVSARAEDLVLDIASS